MWQGSLQAMFAPLLLFCLSSGLAVALPKNVNFTAGSDQHCPELYKAYEKVFNRDLVGERYLSQLRTVTASTFLNKSNHALFLPRQRLLKVPGHNSLGAMPTEEKTSFFIRVLAHELGHIIAFSQKATTTLERIAQQFGWPKSKFPNPSLYERYFFKPLQKRLVNEKVFFSIQSQRSIHEWFAEWVAAVMIVDLERSGEAVAWKTELYDFRQLDPKNLALFRQIIVD